jgi:hypothetical protein
MIVSTIDSLNWWWRPSTDRSSCITGSQANIGTPFLDGAPDPEAQRNFSMLLRQMR